MAGGNFEYAIKKDVRNNPIVRELDRERQWEMWRTLALVVFLVAVLVFSVWRRVGLIAHGYDVDEIQAGIEAAERTNREWRLEIEALRSLSRLEQIATTDLGMVAPGLDDQGVIERVVTSPPPPGSVMASR